MPKLGLGLSLANPRIIGGGGGGFDPNSISGLGLWLKADAGVTVDENDYVTNWLDQSPSALQFVPDWVSADIVLASNYINEKPAIVFSTVINEGVVGLANSSVFEMQSIFAVVKPTAGNFEYATICENNGLALYSTLNFYNPEIAGQWGSYLNANVQAQSILNLNTPYILSARSTNGTDQTYYLNNVDDTNNPGSGFYNSRTEIVIGNGGAREDVPQPFQGGIMEIIAYSTYLTEAQMTQVYNYLNQKYAIV